MAPDQFTPSLVRTEIGERDRFVDELRECGSVTAAAARVGVARSTLYRLRRRIPAFATAWDHAAGRSADKLEAAMLDRAINGVERTKRFANGSVETWREYPEAMALAMLRARLPQVYGTAAPAAAEPPPVKVMTREDILSRIAAIRGDA